MSQQMRELQMAQLRISDNSKKIKEEFSAISKLVGHVADKTLQQLATEGVFVFPELVEEAEDITNDQMILQSYNDSYCTSNVMGFLGLGDEHLIIESRFASGGNDFFLQYLLNRVFDFPNIVELSTQANRENHLFKWLMFLFPHYLKTAMRKGPYKTYITKRCNDADFKGTFNVARHIRTNTPFVGKIAYDRREYSYENDVMELVRHTIEFIRQKPFGTKLLRSVKDEVNIVVNATEQYQGGDRNKIIANNLINPIVHAYYHEYRALQRLCILILQNEEHQIGYGTQQIYGILFDGAWLWEEYVNQLISNVFYHPMNKANSGAQKLFAGGVGSIYPDFISKTVKNRVIADAKYKPVDNIGNKDYLQILAYMLRFDSKKGFYIYPEKGMAADKKLRLNSGSTYENKVSVRDDISVTKAGLLVEQGAENYESFVELQGYNESSFIHRLYLESFITTDDNSVTEVF